MLVEIFRFVPDPERTEDYFRLAAEMREAVESIDGFLGVERFESVSAPGEFVSISFWRDEDAITAWRNHPAHRAAQAAGHAGIFRDWRITVAEAVRDYTPRDRRTAPADSRDFHGF